MTSRATLLAPLVLMALSAPSGAAWSDPTSTEPAAVAPPTGSGAAGSGTASSGTASSTTARPTESSTTARDQAARQARTDELLAMAQAGLIEPLGKRLTTWDLNLEGGFGRRFDDDGQWGGIFRARAGVLFVREPRFYALGATFVAQSHFAPAFGIQAESTSVESGLWFQLEGLLDLDGHVGGTFAAGLSIFGVEVQARDSALGLQGVALAKVRFPVSILVFALTQ
jgi:hypothetical protein